MNKGYIIGGSIIGAIIFFAIYSALQRRRKPPIYVKKRLTKNYNARTIPPFGIYVKESEKDNQALIEHELKHWKQFQDKGLLNYYIRYLNELKKFGYDKMPMEQEARTNETEYCKQNYTECVRTRKSNTVHNPDFRS